jgi:site-specific recombinase XerD
MSPGSRWLAFSLATRARPVSYAADLRHWFGWCDQVGLLAFEAQRPHLELWARLLEERGSARATIRRRLSTLAGFYRFAVIDGILDRSRAEYIRRPKIDTESATLGLDRTEFGAFIAQCAAAGPRDHAAACLTIVRRRSRASTAVVRRCPSC